VQNTLLWIQHIAGMGPEAMAAVDTPAAARWIGRTLGVPHELMRDPDPVAGLVTTLLPLVAGTEVQHAS
jgi:Bacteriophage head to tail connecting protein